MAEENTARRQDDPEPPANDTAEAPAPIRKRRFDLLGWATPPVKWVSPKRKRFWVIVLVLAYTLSGFFLAPWLIERQIVAEADRRLDAVATVGKIRTNPYMMTLEIEALAVTERDGTPVASFERFFTRFKLSSLFNWAWTFREFHLDGLDTTLTRHADGTTNIGRLLASAAAKNPQPDEPVGEVPVGEEEVGPDDLPRVIVEEIRLNRIETRLTDETRAGPFRRNVGPTSIAIDNLNTLPDETGSQQVTIETGEGGRLEWAGTFSLQPLASAGAVTSRGPLMALAHDYMQENLQFGLEGGITTASLRYDFSLPHGEGAQLDITDLTVEIADAALVDPAASGSVVTLPSLRVEGGTARIPDQTLSIEAVTLTGLSATLWRNPDGTLSTDLFRPVDLPAPSPDAGQGRPWDVTLDRLAIVDMSGSFEDRTYPTPLQLGLADGDIEILGLTNEEGASFPFTIAAQLEEGGELGAEGEFQVMPEPVLTAKLTGAGLPVARAQPVAEQYARIVINDGALGFEADLSMPSADAITATGSVSLTALDVVDAIENDALAGVGTMSLDRFDFDSTGKTLTLSVIDLDEPFLKLIITPDFKTNLSNLMIADAATPPAGGAGEGQPSAAAPAATLNDTPWTVTISQIRVAGGGADFADMSLPIPFRTQIGSLEGTVENLGSDSEAAALIDLQGKVGEFGLADIEGTMTPFDPIYHTKVEVLFRNIEFPTLSPYTIKFAGRRIAQGKLELALDYDIDRGILDGANNIVISDIELGEKVEQEGAMNLPLGLAIALLKDSEGRIDIDLPVEGDINDPEVRIGGVVRQAIFNLLTKVVTAPFKLLGSLVGDESANFDQIEFEAGSAELTPPEQEKLLKLSEALAQRPQLKLVLPGTQAPGADRAALQQQAVNGQVQGYVEAQGGSEAMPLQTLRRQALEQIYLSAAPAEPLELVQQSHMLAADPARPENLSLDEPAYIADLYERAVSAHIVSDTELQELGNARASAIMAFLTSSAGLPPERVTLGEAATEEENERGWVPLKPDVESM